MTTKVFNLLSLPRTGTHFFWSRLIASGQYQLIYDADRVPALAVLRDAYDKPLDFLYPPPLNPNYNFQYNSLREAPGPLSAAQHLELLAKKYGCGADAEELFHRIMSRQASEGRTLLSVNRFIYTCQYSFAFAGFSYTIALATRALELFETWLARGPYEHKTTIVVREIDEWVRSMIQMQGRDGLRFVRERLDDFPHVMEACSRLGIRVYDTPRAIEAVSAGALEFDEAVEPLTKADVDRLCAAAAAARRELPAERRVRASMFRLGRFIQYVSESDPVKRLSLVRSIGWLPVRAARVLPVLGRMIRADYEGVVLDNGRIHLDR